MHSSKIYDQTEENKYESFLDSDSKTDMINISKTLKDVSE